VLFGSHWFFFIDKLYIYRNFSLFDQPKFGPGNKVSKLALINILNCVDHTLYGSIRFITVTVEAKKNNNSTKNK